MLFCSSRSVPASPLNTAGRDGRVRQRPTLARTRPRRPAGSARSDRRAPARRRSRRAPRSPLPCTFGSPSCSEVTSAGTADTSRSARSALTTSSRTLRLRIAHQRRERGDGVAAAALAERRGRRQPGARRGALQVGEQVLERLLGRAERSREHRQASERRAPGAGASSDAQRDALSSRGDDIRPSAASGCRALAPARAPGAGTPPCGPARTRPAPRACPGRRRGLRPRRPSGPRSITQSACLITCMLCSITTSVAPPSSRRCRAFSSSATSAMCRPVVGSSSTYSTRGPGRRSRCAASLIRCASPPESVIAGCPSRR